MSRSLGKRQKFCKIIADQVGLTRQQVNRLRDLEGLSRAATIRFCQDEVEKRVEHLRFLQESVNHFSGIAEFINRATDEELKIVYTPMESDLSSQVPPPNE